MVLRGAAGQAALTFAVLILPFILGCELGSGLDDNALVGSWAATSVQQDGVELFGVTNISFALTMRSGGTFSESVTGDLDHVVCKGEGITSCTRDGTYEYTNDYLSFCDPECDGGNQYLVRGNTITYVLVASVNPFSDARAVLADSPAYALGDSLDGPLRHVLPDLAIRYVIVFQRI
jgi:hypothetical protein